MRRSIGTVYVRLNSKMGYILCRAQLLYENAKSKGQCFS
jgi:hypothetical protein